MVILISFINELKLVNIVIIIKIFYTVLLFTTKSPDKVFEFRSMNHRSIIMVCHLALK
jgi:hypothetical protein